MALGLIIDIKVGILLDTDRVKSLILRIGTFYYAYGFDPMATLFALMASHTISVQ